MDSALKKDTEAAQHDNVMLLVMSTLPAKPKMNTYQINEAGRMLYFKSIAQMEPHTKYVLYKLASKGEKLHRIVILESSKAKNEMPENWGKETAVSFYRKRIFNYVGNNSELTTVNAPDPIPEYEETLFSFELYEENKPEIISVDLEDPVYFWKAVKAIRGSAYGCEVHLYMDMQGGDRNAVSQINAIVKLLERQRVVVKGRYANDYEPKRQEPLYTIRDASKEYETYDLISAMDIFARYGWGDKLEDYFHNTDEENKRERELVKAIKDASLGISLCNGGRFENAVNRIKKLGKEFDDPEKITEMDVVYEDIRENYAPLLEAEYQYVAQIRWCLDRRFLQQAMTIFEAKMPTEFVRSGLIYYIKRGEDKEKFFNICEKLYKNLNDQEHYRMKDLNHYLLKDYSCDYNTYEFQDPKHLLRFGLGDDRKEEVITLLKSYRYLCTLRNRINHAVGGNYNAEGFFSHMKKKNPGDKNWKNQKLKDVENEIRQFLAKWEELADQVDAGLREQILDLN